MITKMETKRLSLFTFSVLALVLTLSIVSAAVTVSNPETLTKSKNSTVLTISNTEANDIVLSIIATIYPSNSAAKIDPAEALRYE